MASLQKVKVGRQSYYRIVESRRVNGKPRPVPILHLGTADQLLQRLLAHREPQLTVRSYQHGDVAALKALADRLGLVALMDRHLPSSRRPLSIGTTLLLAAINRAVWPCSKRGWAAWAQRTSLPHLFTLRPTALTSQYFWDQMDAVLDSTLEAIEAGLTRKVIQECHLTLDTLFYDTTNFFTYIASHQQRGEQRGGGVERDVEQGHRAAHPGHAAAHAGHRERGQQGAAQRQREQHGHQAGRHRREERVVAGVQPLELAVEDRRAREVEADAR